MNSKYFLTSTRDLSITESENRDAVVPESFILDFEWVDVFTWFLNSYWICSAPWMLIYKHSQTSVAVLIYAYFTALSSSFLSKSIICGSVTTFFISRVSTSSLLLAFLIKSRAFAWLQIVSILVCVLSYFLHHFWHLEQLDLVCPVEMRYNWIIILNNHITAVNHKLFKN